MRWGFLSHDLSALEVPISEVEVWNTIEHLPSERPRGWMASLGASINFTSRLLRGVMAAISCVWAQKFRFMELLNSAFISLLPKKVDDQHV
jgi:hypothetical protein